MASQITKFTIFGIFFILFTSLVFAQNLPTVDSDDGIWGTIVNNYLTYLSGSNATNLNLTRVNGSNIDADSINTSLILDRTITVDDLADSSINTTHLLDSTLLEEDLSFPLILRTEDVAFLNESWLNNTYVELEGGDTILGTLTVDGLLTIGNVVTNFLNTTHLLDRTLLADDLADDSINTTHILDATIGLPDLVSTLDITNYTAGTQIIVSEHIISTSAIPATNVAFTNESNFFDANNLVDYLNSTQLNASYKLLSDLNYDNTNLAFLNNTQEFTGINHFTQNVSFADNLTVGGSVLYVDVSSNEVAIGGKTAPSTTLHVYENTDDTNNLTGMTLENDGDGDSLINFLLTDTERFLVGIDNSDGNKFKITESTDFGTNDLLVIDPSNENIGIGTASPASPLTLVGTDTNNVPDINITSSDALIMLGDGKNGPHGLLFGDDGGTTMAMVYRTSPNEISFESDNDVSSTNAVMTIEQAGTVDVVNEFTAGTKTFKIDHPLDPFNKILKHSVIESPEMMNVYKGNSKTLKDGSGQAYTKVKMADWFTALNGNDLKDYSFSITPLNGFCGEYYVDNTLISIEGSFIIRTQRECEFSYVVYSVRHDKFAEAHRVQVETVKDEPGYIHEELWTS
jgi:hypothetical protein